MGVRRGLRIKLDKPASHYKKHLNLLTRHVRAALAQIDVIVTEPVSRERGAKIAAVCNALEMANDQAWHFGLGKSLKRRG